MNRRGNKMIELDEITKFINENPSYRNKPYDKNYQLSQDFYRENGFYFEEIWNLDIEICRFLAPRLAFLRDNHTGFPGQLCKFDDNFNVINEEEAREKWNKILDTMVDGFYLYMSKDEFDLTIDEKKTINKALKYFKKYFTALWD